jgi:glutathione S-transferase
MLKLCGFPLSNYFNKVRLVLEERGIPHEVDPTCVPSQEEDFRNRSPMGRIPYLVTDHGNIVESTVIAEYLEEVFPDHKSLLPRDPFERARVRSMTQMLELNVELVARRLFGAAFFGGQATEETKKDVADQLEKGVRAFKSMASFSPFLAGSELTLVDCAAVFHMPYISGATQKIYGKDALGTMPQLGEYLAMMASRPLVQKLMADREKAAEAVANMRRQRSAQAQNQAPTHSPATEEKSNQN